MPQGFANGYALVVGIAGYPHISPLPPVVIKDARDVAGLLASPSFCAYPEQQIRVLLDEQAAKKAILDSIAWLARSVCEKDTVTIFFSCHGGRVTDDSKTANYLLPYDCHFDALSSAISHDELTGALRTIKSQRLALLFDFCYAAGSAEAKSLEKPAFVLKSGFDDVEYQKLASGSGRVLMASSRADETSLVLAGMNNSLFTHYLLDGLRGSARHAGDGVIRVLDVFDYVSIQVPLRSSAQHPVLKAELENNFPLALYRGGQKSPGGTIRANGAISASVLRKAIVDGFELSEFEILCNDVQELLAADGFTEKLSVDIIGGNGLEERAHRLIKHLERRGYLSFLIKAVQNNRPNLLS